MFRTWLAQCSHLPPQRSFLHTSASLQKSGQRQTRAQTSRLRKKENNRLKAERLRTQAVHRPHPVTGLKPGEEWKWDQSDLAKVLVNEDELVKLGQGSLRHEETPIGKATLPQVASWGVAGSYRDLFFRNLPSVSSDADLKSLIAHRPHFAMNDPEVDPLMRQGRERELKKTEQFAKLLDLRNADKGGINFENRRRIVQAFSEPERPFDTGRPEVQAALLTYKIRNLWTHLTTFKRDVGNRRNLRMLVHQRAKILRYLKQKNRERYDVVLERLALEPKSVEGELIV